MGDRLTSLGLGHYLTPNKATAEQYGDNLMEFDVDTTDILDWQNMTKVQRDEIEKNLLDVVPKDRIAGFSELKTEKVNADKEGLARFKELQEKTKNNYHEASRAKMAGRNKDGTINISWKEGSDLKGANDNQLMDLMNEYSAA